MTCIHGILLNKQSVELAVTGMVCLLALSVMLMI